MKRAALLMVALLHIQTILFSLEFEFPMLDSNTRYSFHSRRPVFVEDTAYLKVYNSDGNTEEQQYQTCIVDLEKGKILIEVIDPDVFSAYTDGSLLVGEYSYKTRKFSVDIYDTRSKRLLGAKKEFPYSPEYVEYYQNDWFYVVKSYYEAELYGTDPFLFNMKTGEEKAGYGLPSPFSPAPLSFSPDKLFLLLVNFSSPVLWKPDEKKEVANFDKLLNLGYMESSNADISQTRFLTNFLIIGAHPDTPNDPYSYKRRVIDLQGKKVIDECTFYYKKADGSRAQINDVYFSPDLRYAIGKNREGYVEFYLLDTVSFRTHLEKAGYLFRSTTAVSTESQVRVRENPNLEAKVYGALTKGDALEVTDRSGVKVKIGDMEDWWYKVKRKSDGLSGWAYGAFLKLDSYQGELGLKK